MYTIILNTCAFVFKVLMKLEIQDDNFNLDRKNGQHIVENKSFIGFEYFFNTIDNYVTLR